MRNIIQYFSMRYLPRRLILIFDIGIMVFSWILAFYLRFNFDFAAIRINLNLWQLALVIPTSLFCFLQLRCFASVLRHSNTDDLMCIMTAILLNGTLLTLSSLIVRYLSLPSNLLIPVSVIIIQSILAGILLILSRLLAKALFNYFKKYHSKGKYILIFGAGQMGQITKSTLLMDSSINIKVAALVDDNPDLWKKCITGVPVHPLDQALCQLVPKYDIKEMIIAIAPGNINTARKREIINASLTYGLEVKEVPPVTSWINGKLQLQSIRNINIEDLLGRDTIQYNRERIKRGLKDSVIMVAGAAGSIGSEIVRQLTIFDVQKVILIDKSESDLYSVEQELLFNRINTTIEIVVGDITNHKKMRRIFEQYNPNIVFNAAAYKHVPLMEKHPAEAIRVNVGGTKILADLSVEFGVDKFVYISTDKAVNPTNVMGTSKRISEIYIQALAQSDHIQTKFITTRFGNVLGSNGSVVPLFKKQIEKGGPITVTHRDIIRYFMTIPEACLLVLEAAFIGDGGEIFIFDMGEPVKIYDMAEKMISLSGFKPHVDIKIDITGLRPGEKLYEELLDNREELIPTNNEKLLIGQVRFHDYKAINQDITLMLSDLDTKSNKTIVSEMNKLVPEFKPGNPIYQ